jgi:hypothetical protein
MPEALAQADTFFAAVDNFPTYPAYGEIQDDIVAGIAGETNATTQDLGRAVDEMEAECTCEQVGACCHEQCCK